MKRATVVVLCLGTFLTIVNAGFAIRQLVRHELFGWGGAATYGFTALMWIIVVALNWYNRPWRKR